MENKITLRTKSKLVREQLDINLISGDIVQKIRELSYYKMAKKIMLFYPLPHEINLLDLIKLDTNKKFFLPRINDKELDCCEYKNSDSLVCSKYKIFEPTTSAIDKNKLDIIIIPALCADKYFNRIGYGGGYYDRLLSDYAGVKILVIPDELFYSKLPSESHDIPVDIIVTQSEILLSNSL